MTRTLDRLEAQLRPETQLAAMAALLGLTLLALHLYVIRPGLAQYRELSGREAEAGLLEATAGAASATNEIAVLEGELTALRERVRTGGLALPAQEAEAWIIARLNEASLLHGVRLRSVAPAAPRSPLGFRELPFEVEAAGTFFSLYAWLHALETELRPLVVQRFELAPDAEAGGVRLRLRVVAYEPPGTEASP